MPAMNKTQFRALLDLLMCSDPWPIEEEAGETHKLLIEFANCESRETYGMANWIVAYHEIEKGDDA